MIKVANIKYSIISILLLITSFNPLLSATQQVGQLGIENSEVTTLYRRALTLQQQGKREEASYLFNQIIGKESDKTSSIVELAKSRLALIAMEGREQNWEKEYLKIEKEYPNSPLLQKLRVAYTNNLFDLERYSKFLIVDSSINTININSLNKDRYLFQRGYSKYKIGELKGAKADFKEVLKSNYSPYTNSSHYYLAYLLYIEKEFIEAISHFNMIVDDKRFSSVAQYYILESNYMLGNHLYVVDFGESLYRVLEGAYQRQSARFISESFFALNDFEKAQYYFDKYALSSSNFSRSEYYYAAILAYSRANYPDAIELFKQVTQLPDSLYQNVAYHLGRCYLELKNKIEALHSFREASQLSFDRAIEEDALFNYAKLSFDLNTQIEPFQHYLERFTPSLSRYDEIQRYKANYYLTNKEYSLAIETLSEIKSPTHEEDLNLQKASFLRGMELFDVGAYSEAINLLNSSLGRGYALSKLTSLTHFWLAEAHYRKGEYNKSIESNLKLITTRGEFAKSDEWPLVHFNLGYSYFKLEQYKEAEKWFKNYLNLTSRRALFRDEALVRLGDCLYMQGDYDSALKYFTSLSTNSRFLEYAGYHESLIKGLLGDDSSKSERLKELVKRGGGSSLYPEILYELSRTLVRMGRDREAEGYLNTLIDSFETSQYYSKALLELGMINVNRNNEQRAIEYYKRLLESAPNSPEAESAVAGLENIYKEMGRGDQFLAYIDGLGISESRTLSQRELILFSSAEKLYLADSYKQAIVTLNSFIREFPNGAKVAHALFYLAESYKKTDQNELALEAFLRVMEIGDPSFNELATLNYAKLSFALQNYSQASQAYSSLSIIARLESNKIVAAVGLAHSYFLDKQYRNAIAAANEALHLSLKEGERTSCNYILGRSHFNLGEREQALKILTPLSKAKSSEEGAESSYLIILEAFDRGDYPTVENECYSFAESNTTQYYWLAKSFILLGDTFAERAQWEQAEATYRSVLDSYQGEKRNEIKELVEMRLNRIEEIKQEERDE